MKTNNLLDYMNALCEEFECEVESGNEFAYYYTQSLVVVDFSELQDDEFLAFARSLGLNSSVNAFTVSFFHEVGHNETYGDVEKPYRGNKDKLSKEKYFRLEEEYLATAWAVEYCNTHPEVVDHLQALLAE